MDSKGRPTSADIPDIDCIKASQEWMNGTGLGRPGAYQTLCGRGFPPHLVESKLEHLVSRGLLEYGTSVAHTWPTSKGIDYLETHGVYG